MRKPATALVRGLGAGLPHELVEARIGEADELAGAGERASGRPVGRYLRVRLAVENVALDRRDRARWSHLPTLAVPGCTLIAGGWGTVGAVTGRPGYGAVAGASALVGLTLAGARRYPRRLLAALAVALAALLVHQAAVLTRDVAGERVVAGALVAAAVLLPVSALPLALSRRDVSWADLGEVVRRSWTTRWAWPALGATNAVIGVSELAGAALGSGEGTLVTGGRLVGAAGTLLSALAIRATAAARVPVRRGVGPSGPG